MKPPSSPSREHINLGDSSSEQSSQRAIDEKKAAVQAPMLQVISPELYETKKELGRGGLGQVSQVTDLRLMREVALKQLLPQEQKAQERFLREALITARLQHPSIVPVYEVGFWPSGEPFYSMKMVSGSPLKVLIEQAGSLEERLALLPHILAASEAVAYAHSKKIIHRDLKPHNILVGEFGETVVIDWGIAKDLRQQPDLMQLNTTPEAMAALRLDVGPLGEGSTPVSSGGDLTVAGAVLGTPAYMPIEQAKGNPVDERADVYSLGAVLYQLLAGVPPYSGPHERVILRQVLQGPPIPLQDRQPNVPRDLLGITQKAMSRSPAERYPSAKELADDLRKFQTGQLVGAHQYSTWELLRRWLGRHRVAVLVASGLSVALILTITLAFQRITHEKELAQRSQREAEEQRAKTASLNEQLLLKQARLFLDRNPALALSWLKLMPQTPGALGVLRTIAADALSRGIPRVTPMEAPAELLTFSPDGRWLASAGQGDNLSLWDFSCERPPCGTPQALSGHREGISSLAFSPDGQVLASAGAEPTIKLWTISTGQLRQLSGHSKGIAKILFSLDGEWLASASVDQTVRLWNWQTGESRALEASFGIIGDLAFSPDGTRFAVLSWDDSLRLFEVKTGALLGAQSLIGGGDVVFSPDGARLVAASDDGNIYLWDVASGVLKTLKGHENVVTRVRFSPDGKRLASASWDHTVRLWELSSERPESRVLFGHEQNIQHLEFSPDGQLLASAGQDETIRLWDISTNPIVLDRNRALRGTETSVSAIAFSPDGRYLLSTNHDPFLRLWEVRPREAQPLRGHEGDVMRLAYSPSGHNIATASEDQSIRIWSAEDTRKAPQVLAGHPDSVIDLAYAPDEKQLASIGENGAVFLWTLATGAGEQLAKDEPNQRLRPQIPYQDFLASDLSRFAGTDIAYSMDGRFLAFASVDPRVHLFEVAQKKTTLLDAHKSPITRLRFSPSGEYLVSASYDGEIFVYRPGEDGHRVFAGHEGAVYALGFSPDGKTLASAGYDKSVRLWDVETGAARVFAGHESAVLDLAFSPDGTRLATGSFDQSCIIWSLTEGTSARLEGHKRRVFSVAFSPDSQTLASASFDGTIRLWDVASREVRVLRGHTDEVYQVLFSPDGKWLLSGGRDDAAYLWADDLPTDAASFFSWLNGMVTPAIDPER